MRKIFISVIAIENIYKKPSLEDIMVIVIQIYQDIQTNRDYTFKSKLIIAQKILRDVYV